MVETMYSEAEDFREKLEWFSHMTTALDRIKGETDALQKCRLALEVGGSGGLLAGIVSQTGPHVICTDIENVQTKYNGEFPRLLKEKFQRHGRHLDLGKIEFHTVDAQALIYRDNLFDLVFSLNAMEHISDPIIAVREMWRVLKPGGIFYASFDPVWTADSGSHFMHYTKEPWLHLLVEDEEYREMMRKAGASEREIAEYPNAMNRKPAIFYKEDFKRHVQNLFERHFVNEWSGCVSTENMHHVNRMKAAKKYGWNADDLLIRGFQFVAVK